MSPALLALLLACRTAGKGGEGELFDSGGPLPDTGEGSDEGGDTGDGADGGTPETSKVADWCLDFEDGSLSVVGYEGSFVELEDGGLVFVATEGDDFSALVGEEALDFRGSRALVLRSSHLGDVDSAGVATTPAFAVAQPQLWLWHLSEVDERGVSFTVELLSPDDDSVWASQPLPVQTGGFVPELKPEHDPIAGFPEITTDGGAPGELSRVVLDLSAWVGTEVRLRLRQHTLVEDNGFFTVIDDLCTGSGAPADLVLPVPALTPLGRAK